MKAQPKVSEYDKQAINFLTDTNTRFEISYQYTGPHFSDDTRESVNRDVYSFTLKNARGEYSARFGDSINNTKLRFFDRSKHKKPSAYNVLAALTKYEPGSFDDFCSDFGYNDRPLSEYPAVMVIWQGVCAEYAAIRKLFTAEQIEQLAEIQ